MNFLTQESWKSAAAQAYFLVCAVWFSAVLAGTTALRFHRVLLMTVGGYGLAALAEWWWRRRQAGRW